MPIDQGRTRGSYGGGTRGGVVEALGMERGEAALQVVTHRATRSLREITEANVGKVNLRFHVSPGGETGIPSATKSKAESSLKVAVECSFRDGGREGSAGT